MNAMVKTMVLALLVSVAGTGIASAACKKEGCCGHAKKTVGGVQLSSSDQLRMLEAIKTVKGMENSGDVAALKQQAKLMGDQAMAGRGDMKSADIAKGAASDASCDDCDDCDDCKDCASGSCSDCCNDLDGKTAMLKSECGHGKH